MRKFICTFAWASMIVGCSSIPAVTPSLQQSLTNIGEFTIVDLENADAIAQAQTPPDSIADQCFIGLIAFVEAQQHMGRSRLTVTGAFSAFETSRTTITNATGLASKMQLQSLELACGPLIIDTQSQTAAFVAAIAALGAK